MISLLALTLTLRQTGPAPLVAVITGYRSYRGGWKGYRSRHRREIVISSQGWRVHRCFSSQWQSVVEKVMKCSTKLAKFCINNGRMKEGREGNLFVSLGLTARVTRVQRAQVLQPLCGIIFAWIWEIQNYTMHPMHFQGVSVLFKKFNGRSKPGIPGISGDAASPGICHIPFALITYLVRVDDKLSIWGNFQVC